MDIRKIKKLIELINETGVAEIEIKEGEESVRISRQTREPASTIYNIPSAIAPPPAPATPSVTSTPSTQTAAQAQAEEAAISGHTVASPMVGTLYLSPSPGAKPFVTVGQAVKTGDVLCIIEAMKMFNQIEADASGIIKEIMVNNGQPVEYQQPLFVIEE
jgi:acetyl-CoA carboxylase biotin carboxyl carrier protein